MGKNNFLEYLYQNSLNLKEGTYEDIINDKIIRINVNTKDNKSINIRIYLNNEEIYHIYKGFMENRVIVYFSDYAITQNIENYELREREILFNKGNIYLNEEKIGNNGLSANYNRISQELIFKTNKKMQVRYDYNEERLYLCFLDNNNKEFKKIEYNIEFIENINNLLKINDSIIDNKLKGFNIGCLYDENIESLIDAQMLNKYKETANLFKIYSKKLEEVHEETINSAIYNFIKCLNSDVKYARINALNYYIKNNDLRDPLILKEVYKEVKSIYKSKNNEYKLTKTRKPLIEYKDKEN